jgi:hypothetical protein
VTYILAYRLGGPYTGTVRTATPIDGKTLDLTKKPKTPIAAVLDLVGSNVRYTFPGDQTSTIVASPWGSDLGAMAMMPILMDNVTVNPAPTIPGRININQASATVLAGIPGMTPDIAEQIIALRDVAPDPDKPARRHETWLLQEAVVDQATMKLLVPFICSGGDVHRAQVVGYYQGGQAASRAEVIFDATTPLPRLLFWRDISHLGRGYAVETLGVDFSEE